MVTGGLLDDETYCSLRYRRLCQGKGAHVACQFPLPGPSPSCQNYTKIRLDKELQDFITHDINRRRQRVAAGHERVRGGAPLPKPELMMLVTWDRELAYLAQRLADQCQFVHDDCRATVRYPYAGQSVGEVRFGSSPPPIKRTIRRVIDAWWGERRRVVPSQLVSPFRIPAKGLVWGHFSQLAVWSLRAVGCAAVTHDVSPRLLLVCDFSHTNMLGQSTIRPGPIAPCPVHTERRLRTAFPLLCAPIKRRTEENREDKFEPKEELSYDDEVTEDTTEYLTHTPEVEYERYSEDDSGEKFTMLARKWKQVTEETRDELEEDDTLETQTESQTSRMPSIRPRWKQTRARPNRPGAKALLKKHPVSRRPKTVASLNLDSEDMDQFFQDTGFNIHWRQKER